MSSFLNVYFPLAVGLLTIKIWFYSERIHLGKFDSWGKCSKWKSILFKIQLCPAYTHSPAQKFLTLGILPIAWETFKNTVYWIPPRTSTSSFPESGNAPVPRSSPRWLQHASGAGSPSLYRLWAGENPLTAPGCQNFRIRRWGGGGRVFFIHVLIHNENMCIVVPEWSVVWWSRHTKTNNT